MNLFQTLRNVQDDYLTYVRTFQRFQNARIRDWVMERIEHGTLLWKPPFVQLSRPFAPGDTLETAAEQEPEAPPADQLTREDLHLVCWEYVWS